MHWSMAVIYMMDKFTLAGKIIHQEDERSKTKAEQ